MYLANVLKLLANGVLVLIANVVKEGRWRLKLLVNPMRLRTLKKQKIRFHSYFWYLWKAKIRFHSYFKAIQSRWICINWMQPNENVRLRPLTRKLSESILFVMIHCQGETQWICELKQFVLYLSTFWENFQLLECNWNQLTQLNQEGDTQQLSYKRVYHRSTQMTLMVHSITYLLFMILDPDFLMQFEFMYTAGN